MKKCPYCAEEIQDEAIKCKHCGEFLSELKEKNSVPFYFKTTFLVLALLCIGPFALPLLWFNPRISRKNKIIVSIIVLILSYFFTILMIKSMKYLMNYYNTLLQSV